MKRRFLRFGGMERIALLRSGVLHLRRRLFQPNAHAPTILRNKLDASLFQNDSQMVDSCLFKAFASFKTNKSTGRNLRTLGKFNDSPSKSGAGHTKLNWRH
jgi:hypothetical protein